MRYGLASASAMAGSWKILLSGFSCLFMMRATNGSAIFFIIPNKLESYTPPSPFKKQNGLLPAGEAPDSDPKTFRVALGCLDVPPLNGNIVFAILSVSQGSALVCQGWPTSTSSAFE